MNKRVRGLLAWLLAVAMSFAAVPSAVMAEGFSAEELQIQEETTYTEEGITELVPEEPEILPASEGAFLEDTLDTDSLFTDGADSDTEEIHYTEVYLNPLYSHILTEADLRPDTLDAPAAARISYCTTIEQAAKEVREQMKTRTANISVGLIWSQDVNIELLYKIFDTAVVHTGNPVEGDYLLWQYGGWNGKLDGYTQDGKNYVTISYAMTYYTTLAQEQELDSAVNSLLSRLNQEYGLNSKSNYDKITIIYDYICSNITYDYVHNDNYMLKYTAYGALMNKTCVCQGYALLFYRLMLTLGIDTRLIAGTGNFEDHGWNIVRLNDVYYYVDPTWDAGRENYEYFLKGSTDFYGHTVSAKYHPDSFWTKYPMAESTYHNYGQVEFHWSSDLASCTATFVCTDKECGYTVDKACTVTTETTAATCQKNGEISYTATASLNGYTRSEVKKKELPKGDHDYQYTDKKDGTHKGTCKICGAVVTEAHSYANGSCQKCGLKLSLQTPVLKSASNAEKGVLVAWGSVPLADAYRIFRKVPGGKWAALKNVGKQITSYTDTTAKSGVTYIYTVRAYNASNQVWSGYNAAGVKTAYQAAPVLKGIANTVGGVTIAWNKAAGATGYRVYRKVPGGSWTALKNVGASVTAYKDTSAASGTTYIYTVRAYSSSTKAWSGFNAAGLTLKCLATPALASPLNAAAGVQVRWGKVSGAEGYIIYRKAGTAKNWSAVGTADASAGSYMDKGASSNGAQYTYTVRAYSGSIKSSFLAAGKTVYRVVAPTISGLSNSAAGKLTVRWNRNTQATGYQVQYSLNSNFSSVKTVTIGGNTNISSVLSGLTKGKTYYIRVRSYKTVSGVHYFSLWSGVKSIKINK